MRTTDDWSSFSFGFGIGNRVFRICEVVFVVDEGLYYIKRGSHLLLIRSGDRGAATGCMDAFSCEVAAT